MWTDAGVILRAVNVQSTCLTDCFIAKSAFEKYELDKALEFSVRTDDFIKFLKRADKNSTLSFEFDRDLKIIIKSKWVKMYNMAVGPINDKAKRMPKVALTNKLTCSIDIFKEIIDDVKLASYSIQFKVREKVLSINGQEQSRLSGATLESFMSDGPVIKVDSEKDATCSYGISLFDSMVAALKSTITDIEVEFDSRMPLVIWVEIKGLTRLQHFVAPYIKDDEEVSK